jgi:hypothetical protein
LTLRLCVSRILGRAVQALRRVLVKPFSNMYRSLVGYLETKSERFLFYEIVLVFCQIRLRCARDELLNTVYCSNSLVERVNRETEMEVGIH